MSIHVEVVFADRLSSTGWGECVSYRICGRMAETKSLWEEPDTGRKLTQEAHLTDSRRVARCPRTSQRSWYGFLLRIESP
ncbi:MAG TPA: hypothetical protein VF756_25375 [Thermoanaerobaculia bacterium]